MTLLRTLISRIPLLTLLAFAPLAYAQAATPLASTAPGTLGGFILSIISFIDNLLVPLVFAIAFIVFLWGVYTYFIAGGANEEKRAEGQKFVLWAIIGFVVMFSIWGLINLVRSSLPINGTRPDYPTFLSPG